MEDLYRGAADGLQKDLIVLDFSMAFDKVNYEKLIFKLNNYGMC
jgi:hypothetical protein